MYHVVRRYQRVAADVVEGFERVSPASVHEASGKRGAMASIIKPIYQGMRVCGNALTVQCHPGDNLMLHRAIDMCEPGDVIVASVDGYEGGVWGDLMTAAAQGRGCVGLVIDGFVRDAISIRQAGFPVFARGLSMKGTVKETIGLINHPIACAGVIVRPGDVVVGDDDGVCIVAAENAESVLAMAVTRETKEEARRADYRAGETGWARLGLAAIAKQHQLTEEPVDRIQEEPAE